MDIFIMHIGQEGSVDINYTISKKRTKEELMVNLPQNSKEKEFFKKDKNFNISFSNGLFNCWGIPKRAQPSYDKTNVNDLVLFVSTIGVHPECGIKYIGIVKAKSDMDFFDSSQILWPKTPKAKLYPLLFFFNTEIGFRHWTNFLDDLQISQNWNPRGWYRKLDNSRFNKWGGSNKYLDFLRNDCGFKTM